MDISFTIVDALNALMAVHGMDLIVLQEERDNSEHPPKLNPVVQLSKLLDKYSQIFSGFKIFLNILILKTT